MKRSLSQLLLQVAHDFHRKISDTGSPSRIFCPRCDKPITPDHRCLSRRHFFGMLAGAAAVAAVAPEPLLRIGDTLTITTFTVEPIIANRLYRIGGAYRQYNSDGGDLGIGPSLSIGYEVVPR